MSRRVLICGERDWYWASPIRRLIETLDPGTDVVIHGAAPGADSLAGRLADNYGIKVYTYPADWGQFPKAAGHIRNKQMLVEGKPTEVWAFKRNFNYKMDRGGTENMVKIAQKAGIPVKIIENTAWEGENV